MEAAGRDRGVAVVGDFDCSGGAGCKWKPGYIADRALTLVVKVNAGGIRVEGVASQAGKVKAGVMVLLVPRDATGFPEQCGATRSDSDGSFAIRDVASGSVHRGGH